MIYLISMPMKTCKSPSIVLGLFKALFNQAGLNCRTFDLSLLLASQIGFNQYQYFDSEPDMNIIHTLWAQYVWGDKFKTVKRDFLGSLPRLGIRPTPEGAQIIVSHFGKEGWMETFLNTSMDLLFNSITPTVIGFTCSSIQVLPSLALGKRIREEHPKVKLVYGGSAFFDEMGYEYIEKIPWIDAVATGEADDTVVPLFRKLVDNQEPAGLNGIVYRYGDKKVRSGPPCRPVSQEVFASLPDPVYDDFFAFAEQTGINTDNQWCQDFLLTVEGSRGCSWGQKCQCTFCGVNGKNINIRKKSGGQFYASLDALADKYGVRTMFAADSALLDEYFDTLIPKLADRPPDERLNVIIEVRPNIGRQRIQQLVRAGTQSLQVGIENFSSHILKLFRKGTNGQQCIYFLKLCRQYGLLPMWNYLFRVPGEKPSDYRHMAELLPHLFHLNPPINRTPINISLERFSIYFNEKKNVNNIQPKPWYAYQFPEDQFDLSRIAYIFDAQWEKTLESQTYNDLYDKICLWWDIWKTHSDPPILSMIDVADENRILIKDTRDPENSREWALEPAIASVYRLLDDPITVDGVIALLDASTTDGRFVVGEQAVRRMLNTFVADGLAVKEQEKYLGLALPIE